MADIKAVLLPVVSRANVSASHSNFLDRMFDSGEVISPNILKYKNNKGSAAISEISPNPKYSKEDLKSKEVK